MFQVTKCFLKKTNVTYSVAFYNTYHEKMVGEHTALTLA